MKSTTTAPRRLLFLDPYHKGSHAAFAESVSEMLMATGEWVVDTWTLTGANWKWRMQGAAAHFARMLADARPVDVIMTTDMCDVSRLRGLLPAPHRQVPIILYFHENQLTFPWSAGDPDLATRIDLTYGMTNVMSALAADQIWFNSHFHLTSFMQAAQALMDKMPDARINLEVIQAKSRVMPIPLPLTRRFGDRESLGLQRPLNQPLRLLWNHRWTIDKGMDRFFQVLENLSQSAIPFELILLGVGADDEKSQWNECADNWLQCTVHKGTAINDEEYSSWLQKTDFIVHDPRQEFFGISLVEAMWHGVIPIVPKSGPYPEYVPEEFLSKSPVRMIQRWQKLPLPTVEAMRTMSHDAVTQFCHTSQHVMWYQSLLEPHHLF